MRSRHLSTKKAITFIGTGLFVAGGLSIALFACGNESSPAPVADAAGDAQADIVDIPDAPSEPPPEWRCTHANSPRTPPDVEGVPPGWIQPPCVPANCPVAMAPDPSLMGPAPVWTECGPGCLEHIEEPGDAYLGIFSELLATSQGGKRYLAYTRGLDRQPGNPSTHMLQKRILRLPDNAVTFDMLWLKGLGNESCTFRIEALAPPQALLMANLPTGSPTKNHRVVFTMPLDGGPINGVLERKDEQVSAIWAASSSLWTVAFGYASFEWHDMSPSNELQRAWTTPDGSLLLANMKAVGENVFFGTNRIGRSYQIFAFAPKRGTEPLVAPASVNEAGACWLDTDGADLAWLEAKEWLGGESHEFAERYLMTSMFATKASELKPRILRPAFQNHIDGCAGVVGGGYVLMREVHLPSRAMRLFLTRIEDGAFWEIEAEEGFTWGRALYVDNEELAVIKYRLVGESGQRFYSIMRQSITKLGQPLPASMFEVKR